ncbi:hypothetical protein J7E97_17655 [Streptomyces sp. ISL-66]|uniref:hypothetical protein n=1 Tax=Streptomyces sp. ISL-66 TaxID=2819186 RepID=UPI001BEBC484|nr:hypothetical protein [Streptomyces sp. ISL-66]MBT2469649.1 hypothetical protein [Streptomyces sp. ISL-66]
MVVVTVAGETDGPPVCGGREAPLPGAAPTAPAPWAPRPATQRLRLRVVRTTARAISWYARRGPGPAPTASRRNPDMQMTSAGTAS